jgi:hypothetical protein
MMHETKDGQVFGFCFSVLVPAHKLQPHGFKYPLNRVVEVRLFDKRPEKNLVAEQSWTFPVLNQFVEFSLHPIESPSDKRVDLLSVPEKLLCKSLKGDAFCLKSSDGPEGWCDTLLSFNVEDRSWLVRSCSGFLATYSSVGQMFAVSNNLVVVFSKFGGNDLWFLRSNGYLSHVTLGSTSRKLPGFCLPLEEGVFYLHQEKKPEILMMDQVNQRYLSGKQLIKGIPATQESFILSKLNKQLMENLKEDLLKKKK